MAAADYRNEAEVGEALAEAFRTGLVKREDLFITTKASFHSHAFELILSSPLKCYLVIFIVTKFFCQLQILGAVVEF